MRNKLDKMYDDLFVKEMDVEEWILKYHKMTRDVMTSANNIAYTNMRCQAVSSEVRRRLGKKDKYEVGELHINCTGMMTRENLMLISDG